MTDGDTITVAWDHITVFKVRLIGVDTPEIVPTDQPQPAKSLQYFGREACRFGADLLQGE